MPQSGEAAKRIKKKADALPKASAKKLLKDTAINAAMLIGPGKFLKGPQMVAKAASTTGLGRILRRVTVKEDKTIVDATKESAKIKKKMDKVDANDAKELAKRDAKLKTEMDTALNSGKYKKTTVVPKKPIVKQEPEKPIREQFLRTNRKRDLKAEKYRGSLSKERPPLSKKPKLSNDTKILLEKFQRPKVEPPTTKTSLGGMIGEARPLAASQRKLAKRNEFKTRPIRGSKKDPEDIKKEQISTRTSAKTDRLNRMKFSKPTRPINNKELTKNNRTGKYNTKADEQDLTGTYDIQTVRGKEYIRSEYPQMPRHAGPTIESRASQYPGSRGRNVDKIDEAFKRKKDEIGQAIDKEVEKRITESGKTNFPKANPNARRPRITAEARLIALKRQVRSKRAAEVARKERVTKAIAKLSPKKRLEIKKMANQILKNSKARTVHLSPPSKK